VSSSPKFCGATDIAVGTIHAVLLVGVTQFEIPQLGSPLVAVSRLQIPPSMAVLIDDWIDAWSEF